ncbi:MAG: acylphosphatase [Spirochaetes bacterium]|nr:MAG: acylphosphatase [Spirochaetota bacterium]
MARSLILHGRVQGVLCRHYCSQYGKLMGLHGSASNLEDGTVQVLLATEDAKRAGEYARALVDNPSGVRFFGKIERVEMEPYSGPMGGDYTF